MFEKEIYDIKEYEYNYKKTPYWLDLVLADRDKEIRIKLIFEYIGKEFNVMRVCLPSKNNYDERPNKFYDLPNVAETIIMKKFDKHSKNDYFEKT
ncbi:hypothetical protein DCCM_3217 [Desulfocucumis palustris]|uniref:Uncharacterized protein n=1 Tax=Desulfocucumis palustris TaxID=1898651 RepID=A0A2L2XD01_9FIRM|nr:hypothetical protein DCCM_3217 [Desulfocucumis palustris]